MGEVERLISNPQIPVERRVLYALKAIAGLRHGEAVALRWRHYDIGAGPLGRLTVAVSYDSNVGEEKSTKTGTTRYVPVHPALAKILAAWKLSHCSRIYGKPPGADELIVPARTMRPVNKTDAARAMKEDLLALGLRVEAGKRRARGGHDLRAFFKTRAIEDGADSELIRRITHAPPKDVDSGYLRFSWAVYCREVAKLRLSAESRGEVPQLAASFAVGERRAEKRWRKRVTPPGLERHEVSGMPSHSGVSGQDGAQDPADPEPVPDMAVPSRAQVDELARAVLDGDVDRARELAAAIAGAPVLRLVG